MHEAVSVVIPAYNEESGVFGVITELRELLDRLKISAEVIVVDDGSTDGTAVQAAAAGARVLRHRSNRGYGASLKTGIAAARHEIIAITDADGTYPCDHLPALLAEMDWSDMVVGARVGANVHIPLVRRPAKWVLSKLANYVSGAKIPDLNSGLRCFRRDLAMQYFPILSNQFSFTTTITLAMLCDHYAVNYLPIQYRRRQGRSKIVPWDAGAFAIIILRMAMLFRPLRVFSPIAFTFLAYGLVKMAIDVSYFGTISPSALLGLMSALMIFLIGMLADSIAMRLGRLVPHASAAERARQADNVSAAGES